MHFHGTFVQVDKKDAGTPDEWIKRHPKLIRLTGRYAPVTEADVVSTICTAM